MTGPTRVQDPKRGGARWCDEHRRWECARQRNRGRGTCHQPAVLGLPACRMHAGTTGSVARAKGEALSAWSALAAADDGGPVTVDPARAVMAMLHMSWLRVHLLAGLLERQVASDGAAAPEAGELGAVGHGDASTAPGVPGATGGLVGHVYAADKQAGIFASGEAVRALVQLEAGERDRCVRFAKTAHDMGIADREIELAETQARAVALALGAVLDLLAVESGRREEAQRVFMDRLRELVPAEVGR